VAVVGLGYRLLNIRILDDRQGRPKLLLYNDALITIKPGQNSGLIEIARPISRRATHGDLNARLASVADKFHDAVALRRIAQRPDLDAGIAPISEPGRPRPVGQCVDQLTVNSLRRIDPFNSDADLTAVGERVGKYTIRRGVYVGIVQHN